jgi:hypothetical protein
MKMFLKNNDVTIKGIKISSKVSPWESKRVEKEMESLTRLFLSCVIVTGAFGSWMIIKQ